MLSRITSNIRPLGIVVLIILLINLRGIAVAGDQSSQVTQGGLVLIRHGEAGHNVKGTFNSRIGHPGYTVEPLTEKGRKQVMATASALKERGVSGRNVCRVLVSPMPRTQETAAIISHDLGIPEDRTVIVNDLVEAGVGDREGHKHSEYAEDVWFSDNPEAYGGETHEQIKKRVARALGNALDDERCDFNKQFTLVVSHGLPVYLMLEVLGKTGRKLPTAGFEIINKPVLP